jgi:hypothetical protein
MGVRQGTSAKDTLAVGFAGALATVAAGAVAVLVYGIGYGMETGGTFTAPGGDMDFTGWTSAMAGFACGALSFLAFAWLLVRRMGLTKARARETALPGVMLTGIATLELLDLTGAPGSAVALALIGPPVAALCFAAAAFGSDERAKGTHRLALGLGLLILMVPILTTIA